MQYGTAGKTPSSVSLIAFGCPGRLRISAPPRMTPTWRDSIAVGTYLRLTWRICSPKPGSTLCATASVASGVTSRAAGPVPPVVSTRWQRTLSTSSISVRSISACSSGISRVSIRHGVVSAAPNQSVRPGMPLSSYTPADARSLIETRPIKSDATSVIGRFRRERALRPASRRAAPSDNNVFRTRKSSRYACGGAARARSPCARATSAERRARSACGAAAHS